MAKRKHPILMWTGIVFAAITISAIVIVATLDWNRAKPYIVSAVSKATGRKFAIDGDLNVNLGWITRVRASQIRFENASWSKHPQMAEIGLLDAQIDLRKIFNWRFVLPAVNLSQVRLFLEKNADGAANWEFGPATPVTPSVPQNRTQVPVVEKLTIDDGVIQFINHQTNAQLDLKLDQAEAGGFWEQPVMLKARGIYQKLPMTLSLDGGSYQNLRSSKEPYPLQINLTAGKTKAKIDGNLTEPLAMKGENVTLDIQGDDMANLFPLIRLVFPSTPPYRLKGRLVHEGNVWTFSKFSGQVGGSDLSGEIRVDTGGERNAMKADLVSNLLDFKDLQGFIGGKPGKDKNETAQVEQKKPASADESDRIFPDEHYDLERLKAMDADVRLRAKRILAPNLPIDNLDDKLTLNNGVLKFTPATFGVANGRLEIYSTFDASKQPPKVKIDARLRNLDLKRFLGQSSFAQKTLGPIGGRVNLAGTGNSFRELMATASGNTFIAVGSGEISNLLVRLAGLNVARALGVVIRGDQPIPVRCGLLDLEGNNGLMDVKTLVFDTGNTVISGQGNIDLRDEKVNIVVLPVPKDFSPFSLRSYIRVNGHLKNISAFPDPVKLGTESFFQKAINVVLMFASSPFQPRDLGLGRDIDCNALLAKVEMNDSARVVPNYVQNAEGAKTGTTNEAPKS
jgi:AsmA family protein